MENITVTDGEWSDLLHALRTTAQDNGARADEARDMGEQAVASAFSEQATRLIALADKIEGI